MKLYELSEVYRRLSDLCEEGEPYDVALSQIEDEFETKVINVAKVIREKEAYSKALQEEVNRLSEKIGTANKSVEGLKEYLRVNMENVGIHKVVGDVLNVSLQDSPPSCLVDDITKIASNLKTSIIKLPSNEVPEELLHFKSGEDSVDKREIIKMWKEGTSVPGTVVTQSKHVRIR